MKPWPLTDARDISVMSISLEEIYVCDVRLQEHFGHRGHDMLTYSMSSPLRWMLSPTNLGSQQEGEMINGKTEFPVEIRLQNLGVVIMKSSKSPF